MPLGKSVLPGMLFQRPLFTSPFSFGFARTPVLPFLSLLFSTMRFVSILIFDPLMSVYGL
jgi:hypothetical protein